MASKKNKENLENQIMDLFINSEYDEAIKLLKPLIEKDEPFALCYLGTMYHLGLGVKQDGKKAEEILKKSLKLGYGLAAHNLGTLYFQGALGLSANKVLAKKYYKIAEEMDVQVAKNPKFYENIEGG